MSEKATFIPKKSYKDGHVSVGVRLKSRGWHTGHASIRLEGSADITSAQARELATALTLCADKADAKVAAKRKHEENRKKWREREVAAGRMIVMNGLFK
jgi:hypothetical protein